MESTHRPCTWLMSCVSDSPIPDRASDTIPQGKKKEKQKHSHSSDVHRHAARSYRLSRPRCASRRYAHQCVQRLRHVSQDVLAFLQPFVYSFTWRTAALRPPLDLSFLAACIACFAGGRLLGPVVNFDLDVYRERAWACDYGRGREFDLDLRVQGRDGCKRISVV